MTWEDGKEGIARLHPCSYKPPRAQVPAPAGALAPSGWGEREGGRAGQLIRPMGLVALLPFHLLGFHLSQLEPETLQPLGQTSLGHQEGQRLRQEAGITGNP